MSSLSAGMTTKFGRIKKTWRILSGATLNVDSGGFVNVASGGQITKAAGGRLRLVAAANPGTCTIGELNVHTDNKLYLCTATNTWTIVGTQA